MLAKSVTPSRIEANRDLIKLDDGDMAAIAKFTEESVAKNGFTRFVYPPWGINFGFPDKQ